MLIPNIMIIGHPRIMKAICAVRELCVPLASWRGNGSAINGEEIDIAADSICVHGDNPKAIEFVDRIRKSLIADGIEVKSLYEFIK
ncbi:hypothetical protein RN84_10770 [Fusobacterium nucleatum subsp. nucleatum]|nr:hypothetical protein RN84_10770 [Fusobacterium nucleatum subsp. nucleatum]